MRVSSSYRVQNPAAAVGLLVSITEWLLGVRESIEVASEPPELRFGRATTDVRFPGDPSYIVTRKPRGSGALDSSAGNPSEASSTSI